VSVASQLSAWQAGIAVAAPPVPALGMPLKPSRCRTVSVQTGMLVLRAATYVIGSSAVDGHNKPIWGCRHWNAFAYPCDVSSGARVAGWGLAIQEGRITRRAPGPGTGGSDAGRPGARRSNVAVRGGKGGQSERRGPSRFAVEFADGQAGREAQDELQMATTGKCWQDGGC
jgi:hypothetical protein